MSGPKPDYPINLTEAERKNLEELVRAHKSGQTQVMRAQILLPCKRARRRGATSRSPSWREPAIGLCVSGEDAGSLLTQ